MENETRQSSLFEYSQILWGRRRTVLTVTVAAVIVSLLYSFAATKVYEAPAGLLLTPQLPPTLLQAIDPAATPSVVDVQTEIQVLESTQVADLVRKAIGSAPTVTATQVAATDVVTVAAQAKTPKLAQEAANAYANAYIELKHSETTTSLQQATNVLNQHLTSVEALASSVSAQVSGTNSAVQTQMAAIQASLQAEESTLQNEMATYNSFISNQDFESGQLISPATLPTKPAKPKTAEYVVMALILGLVLGVGLALILRFYEDASAAGAGLSTDGNGTDPYPRRGRHVRQPDDQQRVQSQPRVPVTSAPDQHVTVGAGASDAPY